MFDTPRDFSLPDVSNRIHRRHSPAALNQARWIKKKFDISSFEWRQLVKWITIDSLASKDLDDGIHVEKLANSRGYLLQVTIASPTELIEVWSPIESDMFKRATSIYFWENHIFHMLPNIISTDIASLNHQSHRLWLTMELELDTNFDIRRKDVYKSIFYNRFRHTPESFVDGISKTSSEDYEYFSIMHELARWLREKRENSMRITNFDDADRRITMWERIYWYRNDHISSFIIQEFMIFKNIQEAQFLIQEQIDGIFRNHMPEHKDAQIPPRTLERAEYSTEMLFHRWLWLPEYMHSTSPIRREADYISQRQLLCHIDWREPHYTPEQISKITTHINLQINSVVGLQKEELLDMHWKRIIRKAKRNWDGDTWILNHIKVRHSRWLRIPKSVREEILRRIKESNEVSDWMIQRFLWSDEEEIKTSIRDKILQDTKVVRYLNLFKNTGKVDFEEEVVSCKKKENFTYTIKILQEWKKPILFSKTWEKRKGWSKFKFRARGLLIKWKSLAWMEQWEENSVLSRIKFTTRKKARDYFLNNIIESC